MSKHRPERTEQEEILDRMAERVAQLVDPWFDYVSQWIPASQQTWQERRDPAPGAEGPRPLPRAVVRSTTIQHDPLLTQLLNPADDSSAGGSSAGPCSRPPTNIEGMAAHQDIQFGTQTWCRVLVGQAMPSGPARRLRRLLELAPTLPDTMLRNLDADVMRWWALARTATTWADPPWKPNVRCPVCGVLGKVRVRLYPTTAYCLDCGTAWDHATVDELGAAVQLAAEHAAVAATIGTRPSGPCTTCGQVHEPGDFADPDVYRAHTPAALVGRTTPDVVGTAWRP
ncbi:MULTISPECIES: DUF7341 domain-containing protein [unclassified Isoptericola]|uniref:DUF7341 domain-containing protein n=1 Tax=unclassified Isoptericola TaxID=2623355 RepID=UPI003656056D